MNLSIGDKLEVLLRDVRLLSGAGMALSGTIGLAVQLSESANSLFDITITVLFIIVGLFLIFQSHNKHQALWELAADATRVDGILEPSRTTSREFDGTTFYRVMYSYSFAGLIHTHCVETSRPEKYGNQELLFIQRSRPMNAVFAADLPSVVRQKLLSATAP